jgi:transposase
MGCWLRRPCTRPTCRTGGYGGTKLQISLSALGRWTLEIVKRSDLARGFQILPRRWVVERTLAWPNRNRRLAKDFEALAETAAAWLMLASVKLLSRKLART